MKIFLSLDVACVEGTPIPCDNIQIGHALVWIAPVDPLLWELSTSMAAQERTRPFSIWEIFATVVLGNEALPNGKETVFTAGKIDPSRRDIDADVLIHTFLLVVGESSKKGEFFQVRQEWRWQPFFASPSPPFLSYR